MGKTEATPSEYRGDSLSAEYKELQWICGDVAGYRTREWDERGGERASEQAVPHRGSERVPEDKKILGRTEV